MKYQLRDYQQKASDAAVGFFLDENKDYNALMVLPTGAGKSIIIADITNRLNSDILVFCPQKEILQQNYEKASGYGIDCSMYSASVGQKEISRVTFCTIGSVRNYSELFKHFRFVIIDEVHLLNPKKGMYKDFLKQLKCKVLGLTASPYRLESTVKIDFKTKKPKLETAKSELMMLTSYPRPFFKEIIYHIQTEELVKAGYLAKVNYYDARPKSWDERLLFKNSNGSEYSDNSINRIFRTSKFYSHLSSVILRLLYNVKTRSVRNGILVFVRRIEDAERLARKIDNCAIVSGETSLKEREEILERFKAGKIKVLVNSQCLNTGFDFPALDTVVMARPTMSLAMYYQIIGRCLRPHPSKKESWFIDMCGNIDRFGHVEDMRLEKDESGEWNIYSEGKKLTNVIL